MFKLRKNKLITHPVCGHRALLLLTSVVATFSIFAEQPRLVVGIVIDGLKQETLDLLRPGFEQNGFNRFLDRGVVIDNIDFGTNVDPAAATAILMTGSSPRVNGISGERYYDVAGRRSLHAFADENAMGNYTDEALSPSALRVSTLSDEARIAGAGVTYSHSVAANPAIAIILASHTGNSGVWFNDKTGNWATSTYFKDTPAAVLNKNRTHALLNRLDTMQWKPSPKTAKVADLPDHLTRYPFRHTFTAKDGERFLRYAGSPNINTDIAGLAGQYVTSLELGTHDGIDVLNLAFSLQPYEFTKTAESRYEQYDSYIKLDKALSDLFTLIDSKVGRDKVVIYVAGTPASTTRRREEERWNIPGGEFSSRKAASLLNLYLIALHGNGEWVTGFYDGHFYLNGELAKNKDKDITELRRQSAEFLVRMAGVVRAYTIDDILSADAAVSNAEGQSRNIVVDHAGDVVIDLIPGWSLNDDFNTFPRPSAHINTLAPPTAPFLLSAPGVAPQHIGTTVDARAVAPTVAKVLRIRPPNGAELPAVSLTRSK